jgi:argininosuccinate lyase
LTDKNTKLWDGRFTEATDAFVESFTASIGFDHVLALYDIEGSIAHATMLQSVGIITSSELRTMTEGLNSIAEDIKQCTMEWSVGLEDVHMNIESTLTERIGEIGKKLHTGRSRNDQVATDIRLYLRDAIDNILHKTRDLQEGILDLATNETETIMPGLTHLQIAQPISFAHHLMAWFEMVDRDIERMQDCRKRVNSMPLGSAALAGTTYPINRTMTANLLGFDQIAGNSLDAVSDRDFAIEFCAASSILLMHLSRWAEEMILWTSPQFGFISLPDRFCTGSSIMPQKKNPDVPELVRGKTGRVFGSLISLLTIMKGQPLAYNKDNQEDKEPLFDTVNTVLDCLTAFSDMIPAIEPQREQMRLATLKGFATATDLADYLVKKGLPFRDAHDVVGRLVGVALEQDLDLSQLSLEQFTSMSNLIKKDVFDVLTLEGSLAARNHLGGTAPAQVKLAIEKARSRIRSSSEVASD